MENASKALLISGGILFALLTLSLVTVMVNNINTMETAKDEAETLEQLAKFNAQYEVFNKDKLYGTEVITAVNKALENNYKAQDDDKNQYYVDITIDTKGEQFETEVWREKKNTRESKRELVTDEMELKAIGIEEIDKIDFSTKISLISNPKEFRMNSGMIKFFEEKVEDSKIETDDYKYYINSALKNFKTRIFKADKVEYEEGRISNITFELQPE